MILSAYYQDLLVQFERDYVLIGQITFQDQLDKVYEEVGEVAEAWIGCRGKNPRKGVTHTKEDVAKELADVVMTSLLAIRMLGFDPDLSLHLQAEKTERYIKEFEAQLEGFRGD